MAALSQAEARAAGRMPDYAEAASAADVCAAPLKEAAGGLEAPRSAESRERPRLHEFLTSSEY